MKAMDTMPIPISVTRVKTGGKRPNDIGRARSTGTYSNVPNLDAIFAYIGYLIPHIDA